MPFVFSADETMDIGGDLALPVTDDYPEGDANAFQGKIHWVRIDLEDDDVSHLEPEETKVPPHDGPTVIVRRVHELM